MFLIVIFQAQWGRTRLNAYARLSHSAGQPAADLGPCKTSFHPVYQNQPKRTIRPLRSPRCFETVESVSSFGNGESHGERVSASDEV